MGRKAGLCAPGTWQAQGLHPPENAIDLPWGGQPIRSDITQQAIMKTKTPLPKAAAVGPCQESHRDMHQPRQRGLSIQTGDLAACCACAMAHPAMYRHNMDISHNT